MIYKNSTSVRKFLKNYEEFPLANTIINDSYFNSECLLAELDIKMQMFIFETKLTLVMFVSAKKTIISIDIPYFENNERTFLIKQHKNSLYLKDNLNIIKKYLNCDKLCRFKFDKSIDINDLNRLIMDLIYLNEFKILKENNNNRKKSINEIKTPHEFMSRYLFLNDSIELYKFNSDQSDIIINKNFSNFNAILEFIRVDQNENFKNLKQFFKPKNDKNNNQDDLLPHEEVNEKSNNPFSRFNFLLPKNKFSFLLSLCFIIFVLSFLELI